MRNECKEQPDTSLDQTSEVTSSLEANFLIDLTGSKPN